MLRVEDWPVNRRRKKKARVYQGSSLKSTFFIFLCALCCGNLSSMNKWNFFFSHVFFVSSLALL